MAFGERLTADNDFANRCNAEDHGNQNGDRNGQSQDLFYVRHVRPFRYVYGMRLHGFLLSNGRQSPLPRNRYGDLAEKKPPEGGLMWFHRHTFNDKDFFMNTAALILQLALQSPQLVTDAVDQLTAPGQVQTAELNRSLADFAMQTLSCYHQSARFRGVDLIGRQWSQQYKYGAQHAIVLRIHFEGMSGMPYQMIVAGMANGSSARTAVIRENTVISYNRHCQLERWTET